MRINRNAPWLAVTCVLVAGCNLDLEDPNNPNEESVITTPAGLRQIAVGLQAEYSNEFVDPIYIAGLVADEIGASTAAFESYRLIDAGEPINNDLRPPTERWGAQQQVI